MKSKIYSYLPVVIPVLILAAFTIAYMGGNPYSSAENNMLKRSGLKKEPGYLPGDWLSRQRTYPYGRIKSEHFLKAVRQAAEMHNTSDRSTFNWQLAGPLNIGGRFTDIEMPDGSSSTIYLGAASGGIFKTTNSGNSWTNIFSTAATISIGDLAIGPENPDLIYAGTGEANASSQSFRGDGIYKSTDGGNTWEHSGLDQSAYIGRIIIDHQNENRVFAAACGNLFSPDEHRGIYRSTDGGLSWEKVLFISDSTSGIDLVQHPTNPDILYAAMWERMRGLNYRRSFGQTSGIWKTTDGGDTWTELLTGLPKGGYVGRIGLAISPSDPNRLYAFYDNQSEVEVYRTNNGGNNWSRTNDNAIQGMNSTFGWYFGQVRVHPQFPDIIYLMGVDLYYSSDGGNSYYQLAGYFNSDEIHVDHHAMYIHPLTGRIYEGNDGGFYYSDDLGTSWTWVNNIPVTQFYDIEIDYLNPERLYGGTQDNNSIKTATGNTNDWYPILGGDGFYCLVDYTRSNVVYAEYQWGKLHKSTNSGNSMNYIADYWESDRVNWSAPVIMHPTEPNTLYFGTYRVWRTTNGGNSWSAVSQDLTNGDDGSTYHTISTLGISSVDPNIVLAGTDDGRVHISVNGGSLWNDISAGLPDRWITRVAADPFAANTIYVTCSGFRWDEPISHVYRSEDLGQTWEPISSNLPEIPVNAFVADPTRQGRFFIGTDAGVFMTSNYGESWESMNGGLGNVPVTSMKIHSQEQILVIGTYGLSAYRFDLKDLSVDTEDKPLAFSGLTIAGVYPSPWKQGSSGGMWVNVGANTKTDAVISLMDMQGRRIGKPVVIHLAAGMNSLRASELLPQLTSLKAGYYLISVESGGKMAVEKFLVL